MNFEIRSSVTVDHKFYDSRCKNVAIRVPFSRTISQFLPSKVTWRGKDEPCPHFRTRQWGFGQHSVCLSQQPVSSPVPVGLDLLSFKNKKTIDSTSHRWKMMKRKSLQSSKHSQSSNLLLYQPVHVSINNYDALGQPRLEFQIGDIMNGLRLFRFQVW